MAFLLLLLVLLAALAVAIRFMPEKDSKFHVGTASLQALITVLFAAVAGYWYLIERKGMPHATIALSATGVRISETTALVQARVEIENSGHVLLAPPEWDVRLLAVVPPRATPAEAAAAAAATPGGFERWPETIGGAPAYYNGELRWTTVRRFNGPAILEIEPGERDVKTFDLLVSCELRTAKVTVALRKPARSWWQRGAPEGGWWWSDRMLFSLGEVCDRPVGEVRELGPASNDRDDENESEGG